MEEPSKSSPMDSTRIQTLGQEGLGDGVERLVVLRAREAVSFVWIKDISDRDVARLHRLDDLFGLGTLHARVVRAMADQQRPDDPVGVRERRALFEQRAAFFCLDVSYARREVPLPRHPVGRIVSSSVTRFAGPAMSTPQANFSGVKVRPTRVE